MPNKWLQEFSKLQEFLDSHPEVKINETSWSVPGDLKHSFYSLFDSFREAVISQKCLDSIDESRALISAYKRAADDLIEWLNIESIDLTSDLNIFITDPKTSLVKSLFNPSYQLLKGEIQPTEFETIAEKVVEEYYFEMLNQLYEKWVILSFANFLMPVEVFQCLVNKPKAQKKYRYRIPRSIKYNLDPPVLMKPSQLSLKPDLIPLLTVPDFIIKSTSFKNFKYFSVRTKFRAAEQRVLATNNSREWFAIPHNFSLDDNTILIYFSDSLVDIRLIAEWEKMCHPDLIIKYNVNKNIDGKALLTQAQNDMLNLKPNHGLWLISNVPLDVQSNEIDENIKIIDGSLNNQPLHGLYEAVQALFGDEYIYDSKSIRSIKRRRKINKYVAKFLNKLRRKPSTPT